MNKKVQLYIDEFWRDKKKPNNVNVWQFGASADALAKLVIEGKKTATNSPYVLYEIEKEEIPKVGEYSIILSSKDEPVAIIKNISVEVVNFNKVTEDFALAEGEGTYEEWWRAHVEYYKSELKEHNLEFKEDMLVVCERFKLINIK